MILRKQVPSQGCGKQTDDKNVDYDDSDESSQQAQQKRLKSPSTQSSCGTGRAKLRPNKKKFAGGRSTAGNCLKHFVLPRV